uniref:Uncharacterized protein n=1 Tax=Arion vulgaris TaxID=1028688 RepID=A0A0B7A8X6_9EUPU
MHKTVNEPTLCLSKLYLSQLKNPETSTVVLELDKIIEVSNGVLFFILKLYLSQLRL